MHIVLFKTEYVIQDRRTTEPAGSSSNGNGVCVDMDRSRILAASWISIDVTSVRNGAARAWNQLHGPSKQSCCYRETKTEVTPEYLIQRACRVCARSVRASQRWDWDRSGRHVCSVWNVVRSQGRKKATKRLPEATHANGRVWPTTNCTNIIIWRKSTCRVFLDRKKIYTC